MFSNDIIIFVLKYEMFVALYADFRKVNYCAVSSVFVDAFRKFEGHSSDSPPVITGRNLDRLIGYEVAEINYEIMIG